MATDGVGTVAVSIADHNHLLGQAISRGRIYLSMDDGATLEAVFHDSAISAGDIIYHQGVYWVPVADGNVLFSSDGGTWEAESTGGEHQPYAMAAHDGTFVTAGALGEILYRNQQGLWSAPVRLNSGLFTAVTRGKDSWIVVGTEARTSSDGINWKAENLGTTRTMRGVAAIGEIAVAAGDVGTVSVRNRWGVWTLAPSLGWTNLRSIVAFQEKFYIINDDGELWSSLDGFFWEEEERIPVQRIRRLKVVGDRLVATSHFGEIITGGPPSPAKTTLSYSEWIEAHADEFPPERRGESNVNGALGIPNLLAYGLGVLPSSAKPTDLPLLSKNDDFDLVFEYKRNRSATGIVYRALQSEDLSIWAEAPSQDHSLVRVEDEHEVWQAIVPRSSNRRFVRLEVSYETGP